MAVPSINLFVIIPPIIFLVWYYFPALVYYPKLLYSYVLFNVMFLFWLLKGEPIRILIITAMQRFCSYNEKHGMFRLWITKPAVVVFNPAAVKCVMNEQAANAKTFPYNILFLRSSVFASSGERWKQLTRNVMPAFQHANLKQKLTTLNKHSRELVEKLSHFENNTTTDALQIIKDTTLVTFLEALLGMTERSSFGTEFYQNLRENIERLISVVVEITLNTFAYPKWWRSISSEKMQFDKQLRETFTMVEKILEKLKKDLLEEKSVNCEVDNKRPKLLGESLIESHLKDPSFTMDDLVKEMLSFFAVGYETTAVTCFWALYLLGLHQDVQSRLKEEIDKFDEDITHEDLSNMEYLDCILKESLRVYGTVPMICKSAMKDFKCGQSTILKDTIIIIPIFYVHKNPDIFPDPEKFDPERFRQTRDSSSQSFPARTFVPFAEGLRPCLGKSYALRFLKIMIVHVIRNFKVISLDRPEDVEVAWSVALYPAKPLRMQFISRDAESEVNAPI